MATGYVLATAKLTVNVPANGYVTKTNLLTGISGHIYLIKHMRIKLSMTTTGTSQTGSIGFDLSDSGGAAFTFISKNYSWVGIAVAANQQAMFIYSSEQVPVAFEAWDATANSLKIGTENIGKNLTLQSGQILRFNPTGIDGAGSIAGQATMTLNFEIEIAYLDYTI